MRVLPVGLSQLSRRGVFIAIGAVIAVTIIGGAAVHAALGGSHSNSANAVNLQKGLVGWWKMDGNAKDATPYRNNGTVTNATLTTDRKNKSNSAYSFNGTNAYINAGTGSSLNVETYTLSMWVKTTQSGTYTALVERIVPVAGNSYPYTLDLQAPGTVCLVASDGTHTPSVCTTSSINDGSWHLLTTTKAQGGSMKIYVDGALQRTASDTNTSTTLSGAPTYFGRRSDNSHSFSGSLDDIRIYNRVLSTTEITALYKQYDPGLKISSVSNGLVGWWRMDGNAKDSSPNHLNGTLNLAPTLVADHEGRANSAYSFDGTNNQDISIPDNPLLRLNSTGFSVSFWARDNGSTASFPGILRKGGSAASGNGWAIFYSSSDYQLCFKRDNTLQCTATGALSSSTTKFYQFSFDGTHWTWYINGVVSTTGTASFVTDTNTTAAMTIGLANETVGNKMVLDDVRIYSRALTATEDTAMYKSYNSQVSVNNLQHGLVGYWSLDGGAKDSTPYRDNGTISGATLTTDRKGIANAAYAFDGTSNQISIPDSTALSPTSTMTISVWFKGIVQNTTYATSGSIVGIVSKDVSTGVTNPPYSIQITNGAVTFNINSSTNSFVSTGATGLLDNTWYHAVGTFDGTTMKFYLNGAQKSNTAQTNIADSTNVLRIGTQKNGFVRYFNGSIDDVRIWNRALSSTEVAQLYAEYQ